MCRRPADHRHLDCGAPAATGCPYSHSAPEFYAVPVWFLPTNCMLLPATIAPALGGDQQLQPQPLSGRESGGAPGLIPPVEQPDLHSPGIASDLGAIEGTIVQPAWRGAHKASDLSPDGVPDRQRPPECPITPNGWEIPVGLARYRPDQLPRVGKCASSLGPDAIERIPSYDHSTDCQTRQGPHRKLRRCLGRSSRLYVSVG